VGGGEEFEKVCLHNVSRLFWDFCWHSIVKKMESGTNSGGPPYWAEGGGGETEIFLTFRFKGGREKKRNLLVDLQGKGA